MFGATARNRSRAFWLELAGGVSSEDVPLTMLRSATLARIGVRVRDPDPERAYRIVVVVDGQDAATVEFPEATRNALHDLSVSCAEGAGIQVRMERASGNGAFAFGAVFVTIEAVQVGG